MRKSSAFKVGIAVAVLVVASGWTFATTLRDPCAPERSADPERLHERMGTIQYEEEPVECVLPDVEVENEPDCQETRRILTGDQEARLAALEALISGQLHLADCPEGVEALRWLVRSQKDPFLVYRAVEALSEASGPLEILDLIDHPSVDVRRKVAELLNGEAFDDDQAARVASALAREEDPWTKLAIAETWPEGREAEAAAVLTSLVRGNGPAAPAALGALAGERGDSLEPILAALEHEGPLRAAAVRLLARRGAERAAAEPLLDLMEVGFPDERLHAGAGLVQNGARPGADAWLRLVLDPALFVSQRAVLVLKATGRAAWRPLACESIRADPALATEVHRVLTEQVSPRLNLPALLPLSGTRSDEGTLRPHGQTSVRCASRPGGPPRPGAARLTTGERFQAEEWFTHEGVLWLAQDTEILCWIPSDVLDREGRLPADDPEDVLEADVTLEVLDALRAALKAGDLEAFDPSGDYVGIRLRGATQEQVELWHENEEGRLSVLRQVEDAARARERRGQAHRARDGGGE